MEPMLATPVEALAERVGMALRVQVGRRAGARRGQRRRACASAAAGATTSRSPIRSSPASAPGSTTRSSTARSWRSIAADRRSACCRPACTSGSGPRRSRLAATTPVDLHRLRPAAPLRRRPRPSARCRNGGRRSSAWWPTTRNGRSARCSTTARPPRRRRGSTVWKAWWPSATRASTEPGLADPDWLKLRFAAPRRVRRRRLGGRPRPPRHVLSSLLARLLRRRRTGVRRQGRQRPDPTHGRQPAPHAGYARRACRLATLPEAVARADRHLGRARRSSSRSSYTEWAPDGRLRQPVFAGLRPDKRPTEVHRDG